MKTFKFLCIVFSVLLVFPLSSCQNKSTFENTEFIIEDLSEHIFLTGETYQNFSLEIKTSSKYDIDDICVVIVDPSIINISYEKNYTALDSYISFDITALKTGKTEFYFETTDKSIKSEMMSISVLKEMPTITVKETETTKLNKNMIVYITSTGKRYHYRKNCAGENAIRTLLSEIDSSLTPCQKCVK